MATIYSSYFKFSKLFAFRDNEQIEIDGSEQRQRNASSKKYIYIVFSLDMFNFDLLIQCKIKKKTLRNHATNVFYMGKLSLPNNGRKENHC